MIDKHFDKKLFGEFIFFVGQWKRNYIWWFHTHSCKELPVSLAASKVTDDYIGKSRMTKFGIPQL